MSTLERAIVIAAEAHAGQVDKADAPYILHVLRVMLSMERVEEQVVAALHDLVEDTHWSLDASRAEGFSEDIVRAVDALTRRDEETYKDFVTRAGRHPIARRVKLADLADNCNLQRIAAPTQKNYARIARYRRAIKCLGGEPRRPAP